MRLEQLLLSFYQVSATVSISQFILTEDRYQLLLSQQQGQTQDQELPRQRAAVMLLPSNGTDELFIGVYFAPEILAQLQQYNPLQQLNERNLDALCVAVEEISHFHLIVSRAANHSAVTQLELEWQGEVDKLLIASTLLHHQCRDPHYLALARRLYDMATITATNSPHYWEATKFAAQFWYNQPNIALATQPPARLPDLQKSLTKAYAISWQAKLQLLDAVSLRKAG